MTTATRAKEYTIRLRSFERHPKALAFIRSKAKRKIARAGRRGAKTTAIAELAVEEFVNRRRILYGTPTNDQITKFWHEVKLALAEPIEAGIFTKNETMHVIELNLENPAVKAGIASGLLDIDQRIRAKTAFNADTLRGDYADLLILDEWQLMDEDAWGLVGAPMLLDRDGDAVFIYTPPSLNSKSVTKARDPRHASKMFKTAEADKSGRWETFKWTSHDNPFISVEALEDITLDMTALAYRQEIMAEDIDEVPGALWTRGLIDSTRVDAAPANLTRIVIGVDPPGGATECGIVVVGLSAHGHRYVLEDCSLFATPEKWAETVVDAYHRWEADRVVGEDNYGGDMVESTIRAAARMKETSVSYKAVHATRGKAVRAEPQVAGYERGQIHHVGVFPHLEEEMVTWTADSGQRSPNRIDGMIWAQTELDKPSGGRIATVL